MLDILWLSLCFGTLRSRTKHGHDGFKRRDGLARDAEHFEEFVPEGLFLARFARGFGVFIRELNRAVSYFVPGERHYAESLESGV